METSAGEPGSGPASMTTSEVGETPLTGSAAQDDGGSTMGLSGLAVASSVAGAGDQPGGLGQVLSHIKNKFRVGQTAVLHSWAFNRGSHHMGPLHFATTTRRELVDILQDAAQVCAVPRLIWGERHWVINVLLVMSGS
jgi:hypothetical protein